MKKENEIKREIRSRIESATLLQRRNQRLKSGLAKFKPRGQSAFHLGKENKKRNYSLKVKMKKNQPVYQKDIKDFVLFDLNENGITRKK